MDNTLVVTDPTLPDNPLIYVNEQFEALTGYSYDEAVGRNCRFLQGEDRDQPEIDALRDAVRGGRNVRAVLRNYRKDGSMFRNELYLTAVHDEAGKLRYFLGVQNDITELYDAKQEAEGRYQDLFETMTQGVVYQDTRGRIIAANPAAEYLLGLSLDQLQGRDSVDPRWRALKEDGSPLSGEDHPPMIALRTGKVVSDVVMAVYNPQDDAYRWLSWTLCRSLEGARTRPTRSTRFSTTSPGAKKLRPSATSF